jgi:hypothetical protein
MKGILLLPMLLCGCASTGAGRASLNVRHEIVYVDRPVAAVKASDIPVPPCRSQGSPAATLAACLGTRPADARQALDLATARLLELIGYADIADPLLHSAAAPPAAAKP